MKAIQNSGWLLFDKISRMFIGFFVSAWVARYLGPSVYGEFALSQSIIFLLSIVAFLGLDGIVVKYISSKEYSAKSLIINALLIRLFVGTNIMIYILIYHYIYVPDIPLLKSLYVILSLSLVFQAFETLDLWFQSESNNKATVKVKLPVFFIIAILKALIIYNELSVYHIAGIFVLESFFVAVGLMFVITSYPMPGRFNFDIKLIRKLIKESWPFIISGLSVVVYIRLDQLIIDNYLGTEQLGLFASIVPLTTVWVVIPSVVSLSFAPILARAKQKSEQSYYKLIESLFFYFSLFSWVICISISLLSDYIVNLVYGEAFSDASKALEILIFTNLFISLGIVQNLWLINEKLSKFSMYKSVVGAFVSVVVNILLVPSVGIAGAAISSVLAQFTSNIVFNMFFCREIFKLQIRALFLVRLFDGH